MEMLNNKIAHLAVSSVCHSAFPTLTDLTFPAILEGFVLSDISRSRKQLFLHNKQSKRVQ